MKTAEILTSSEFLNSAIGAYTLFFFMLAAGLGAVGVIEVHFAIKRRQDDAKHRARRRADLVNRAHSDLMEIQDTAARLTAEGGNAHPLLLLHMEGLARTMNAARAELRGLSPREFRTHHQRFTCFPRFHFHMKKVIAEVRPAITDIPA